MSWATSATLSLHDGVDIDRFLLQLTTPEHRPIALDDLRRADALGAGYRRGSPHLSGRRTLGRDHHLERLGVVQNRAEWLAELMQNRVRERRHGLAAIGVGGERQVPAAVDLGALPCAALEQEPDDQERLDDQCAGRAQNRAPVFAPQAGSSIAHDAARRQPALGDAPALQLAPVEYRLARRLGRYPDAARRRAVQDSNGHVGRVVTEVVDGHQPAADNARAEVHAHAPQTREHSPWREGRRVLARPRTPPGGVRAEREIENRRVAVEGSHSGAGSPQGTNRRTRQMSGDREIARTPR